MCKDRKNLGIRKGLYILMFYIRRRPKSNLDNHNKPIEETDPNFRTHRPSPIQNHKLR